ncbi:universal stress protein [Falsigemmobacter faecalis]|uniref:Universal stress protein n=1 Tax=Falsigemmobacter faecalis TaxID=2488730 RepID=A0A3P3DB95_9RHOB|nr:universal stress protein [Falsigemmobacter faecalis]RRH71491.1 universal stress protein [Falsigemmobacter faecalis]
MYKNILVPVIQDHETTIASSMAAARVLCAEGGRITLLTVLAEIPTYVSQYLPQDQLQRNLTDAKEALEAEFAGQGVSVEVRAGHAAQTILDVAEADAHDCIVIASHRPGLQDYFLGSTAARVVRHAQCSVHVLR